MRRGGACETESGPAMCELRVVVQFHVEALLCTQRFQGAHVRVLLEQRQRGTVVDARCDGHPDLQGGTLGLILQAGIVHGA